MKNKDELYKLSQSRLQKLLNQYQEIQEESLILEKDFRRVPLNKLHELLPPTSKWSVFYELEYPRHLMFVLRWIGVLDGYLEAARSDNPLDNVLTYIDTFDKKAIKPDENPKGGVSEADAILSQIALLKTLKSRMVFGKTLSKLHEEVGKGSFSSLYKALKIDPAFITTPNGAYLFSIGLLKRNRKDFTRTIHNKMSATLKKHNQALEPIRFILTAMTEVGDYEKYTQSDRYKLFVEDLMIYSSTSKNDNKKDEYDSLNEFIRKWRREAEVYPPPDGTKMK